MQGVSVSVSYADSLLRLINSFPIQTSTLFPCLDPQSPFFAHTVHEPPTPSPVGPLLLLRQRFL